MARTKFIIELVLVVAVLALVFFGYQFFIRGTSETPAVASLEPTGFAGGGPATGGAGSGDPAGEFLQILLNLQRIDLSSQLFSDPLFRGLTDFSTVLPTKTPGRQNPFAAIGVGGPPRLGEAGRPATTTPSTP